MKSFQIAHCPSLYFGPGKLSALDAVLAGQGFRNLAVVTGSSSLRTSERWAGLKKTFAAGGREFTAFSLRGEPSPKFIDDAVAQLRDRPPQVVIAIGGGSVIDAGKAISAMMMEQHPSLEFLEGVGTRKPSGRKIPFIAVPTTSGTGSEATKNAVLSSVSQGGFKKSLRHDGYVPDLAILDPELSLSCPPDVTAACGMDAVTQLLEGFVSTQSNPLTDALSRSGLSAAGRSLERAVEAGGTDLEARGEMAYAAYLSGIVLANAGLGVVHGIASPLGGHFPISHGVVCGTLIAEACRTTIRRLKEEGRGESISKYAEAGTLLSGRDSGSVEGNCELLVATLASWIERFALPTLGSFGLAEEDLRSIARESDSKSAPIALTETEIFEIMRARR
ncbi:MAG TPA: iron-containing alcohol dehydrogenase [Spirochaetia bacterium]|nr:iron-containing alcohol dehydrogenase [Spirochaetia bacterium]